MATALPKKGGGRKAKGGDNNLKCPFCDYIATHRSNLSRHMQRHSDQKSFACTFCEYRTADKSQLDKHTLRHTRPRPHKCQLCPYAATKKSDLKAHVRTHTGERPHACPLCDYKAAHKSTLTAHLRRHKGEKPHACDLCDYRSTTKSDLTKHKRVHTRDSSAHATPRGRPRARLSSSPQRSTQQETPIPSTDAASVTPSRQAIPVTHTQPSANAETATIPTMETITPQTTKRGLAKRRGYGPPTLTADSLRPYAGRQPRERRPSNLVHSSNGRLTPITPSSSADSPAAREDVAPSPCYGFAL